MEKHRKREGGMIVATDGRGSLFNTIVTNGLYIVLKVEKCHPDVACSVGQLFNADTKQYWRLLT